MATNYYEILEVSKDASNKDICEAYKKMALKWHPDKNLDNKEESTQRFLQISQAYQVLSDNTKRLKYDRGQCVDEQDFSDYYYDVDDDDDDGPFFFISAEMLFRNFFRMYREEQMSFHNHHFFNEHRKQTGKPADDGRHENRRNHRKNFNSPREECQREECQTRMVNGKRWMTKTYYEDGNKVVLRYEDGDLISKQINGIPQSISQK